MKAHRAYCAYVVIFAAVCNSVILKQKDDSNRKKVNFKILVKKKSSIWDVYMFM